MTRLTLIEEMSVLNCAKLFKNKLYQETRNIKVSLKDIKLLITCSDSGKYEPMFSTVLYTKKSGTYCHLLELIEELKINTRRGTELKKIRIQHERG